MRATNRLTVTMSVSFRATLAYGSGQGNVGLREKSRTITFGHNRPVIFSRQRSFKRRLRSETCLISYFRSSAFADDGGIA